MKSPLEIVQKLKKGCNKIVSFGRPYDEGDYRCGATDISTKISKILLCTECIAKTQTLLDFGEYMEAILAKRRAQINLAFEGKDERMMAHLHTFVNKFEEEIDPSKVIAICEEILK